jgi:hypothetical protein
MRVGLFAVVALIAMASTEASTQVLNLSGPYRCVHRPSLGSAASAGTRPRATAPVDYPRCQQARRCAAFALVAAQV